jgi:hypothetical protein
MSLGDEGHQSSEWKEKQGSRSPNVDVHRIREILMSALLHVKFVITMRRDSVLEGANRSLFTPGSTRNVWAAQISSSRHIESQGRGQILDSNSGKTEDFEGSKPSLSRLYSFVVPEQLLVLLVFPVLQIMGFDLEMGFIPEKSGSGGPP